MYRSIPYFFLLFLLACAAEPEPSEPIVKAPEGTLVRTHAARPAGPAAGGSVSGVVVSNALARPSSKTGGLLAAVSFREGQDVRRGQILARIDATELQTGVARAEAGLEKARRDLARVEALLADSVATRTQRDDAATAVRLAEEQLAALRFNRNQNVITAPISGRIVQKLANAGEAIGPGMPVAVIQGTAFADWRVRAGLTDAQWAAVAVGTPVAVTFDAFNGRRYPGRIVERAAAIDRASGTFPVEVALDERPPSLAAGLLAELSLPVTDILPADRPLLIPLAALGTVSGKEAEVFVVEDGRARARRVQLGRIRDGEVEVLDGLAAGREVIVTGVAWLMEGEVVEVAGSR